MRTQEPTEKRIKAAVLLSTCQPITKSKTKITSLIISEVLMLISYPRISGNGTVTRLALSYEHFYTLPQSISP